VSGGVQFRSGSDWWSGGLKYRRPVLEGIATEKADVVVFNGDLVEKGSDKGDWALFDREMRGVLKSTSTFVSTIGNHDLKGNKDLALQQFFSHVKAEEAASTTPSGAGQCCW
jgi:metallophosphoesterase superfamily enzyme